MAEALRPLAQLGEQPVEYLHMTMQMLDAYEEDLSDELWQRALADLGRTVATLPAFTVNFAAPSIEEYAVEAVGQPQAAWSDLVDTLQQVLTRHGLAHTLTAPPYGPHCTVAYCRSAVDDSEVERLLRPVATATSFRVDQVSLVAADQHPDEATYSFRVLESWPMSDV
jgi:2'-5' RNA ligase